MDWQRVDTEVFPTDYLKKILLLGQSLAESALGDQEKP
jgi:hypothetical protein